METSHGFPDVVIYGLLTWSETDMGESLMIIGRTLVLPCESECIYGILDDFRYPSL